MLFLLDILDRNRFIELYLKLVRKYLTRHHIRIEDQIRYRFAVWLLTVEDYLLLKFRYMHEYEESVPIIKHATDNNGNIIGNCRSTIYIKGKV